MMNRLWAMKNKKDKRGFTLIELIIVIAILAILMMIAIPAMSSYIQDSRERTAQTNARTVYGAVMAASANVDFVSLTTPTDVVGLRGISDAGAAFATEVAELLGEDFDGFVTYSQPAAGGRTTVTWQRLATDTGTNIGTYPQTTTNP